jgi:hypothetical protein
MMKSLSVSPSILCVHNVTSALPQGQQDVWMMPLLFGKFSHSIDEIQLSLAKTLRVRRINDLGRACAVRSSL